MFGIIREGLKKVTRLKGGRKTMRKAEADLLTAGKNANLAKGTDEIEATSSAYTRAVRDKEMAAINSWTDTAIDVAVNGKAAVAAPVVGYAAYDYATEGVVTSTYNKVSDTLSDTKQKIDQTIESIAGKDSIASKFTHLATDNMAPLGIFAASILAGKIAPDFMGIKKIVNTIMYATGAYLLYKGISAYFNSNTGTEHTPDTPTSQVGYASIANIPTTPVAEPKVDLAPKIEPQALPAHDFALDMGA